MTNQRSSAQVVAATGLDQFTGLQTMLQLLCEATGQRIALIARVTSDSWTCCAVRDHADFGLVVGQQLELITTY